MKIVIDIPAELFNITKDGMLNEIQSMFICGSVTQGTPLPKGHGRLIDADKYRKDMQDSREFNFFATLDFQPTIIEADKAESEDKLDGNPVDIDKAVEHYDGTLEMLKGIDLEDNA